MFRGGNVAGAGILPNLSMPPPMSMQSASNANTRRASPIGYDSGPLGGLPSVFGNVGGVTVQTGMMGPSSVASGLTPPIRNAQMTQMHPK